MGTRLLYHASAFHNGREFELPCTSEQDLQNQTNIISSSPNVTSFLKSLGKFSLVSTIYILYSLPSSLSPTPFDAYYAGYIPYSLTLVDIRVFNHARRWKLALKTTKS